MLALLAKNWWLLAVRGVAAILFGIATFIWPQVTLQVVVFLFGAYALVDGVASIVAAVRGDPGTRGHGLLIALIGIISVIAGVGSFVYPNVTALALLYVIAVWALIFGIAQIYAAYRLRKEIEDEVLLAIAGLASVAFGVLLIAFPGSGILSLLTLVAIWSIIFGVVMLVLAFRLRGLHDNVQRMVGTGSAA